MLQNRQTNIIGVLLKRRVWFAVCFVITCLALSFVPKSVTGVLTVAIIEPVKEGKTYTNNTIPISITTGDHQFPSTGYYSVDGGPEVKINEGGGTFKTTLHLADGKHTIHARTVTVGSASATTTFIINTTIPFITLESPQNQVYHNSTIDLTYTLVDKERIFATYNLDNKEIKRIANVPLPIPDTTTPKLSNLTDGTHHIVIYAEDDLGTLYSAETSFEIRTNPLVTTDGGITTLLVPVAILVPIIIVLTIILLIHFPKRKKGRLQ